MAAGALALIGTLGAAPARGRHRRRLAAVIALAGALLLALLLGPLVSRSGGSAFAAAHTVAVLVALLSWGAATTGLVLGGAPPFRRGAE